MKYKMMKYMMRYARKNNIHYHLVVDGDYLQLAMIYKYENCPNRYLEACIWFKENCAEARVYYSKGASNWFKEADDLSDIYRILNYINAKVWPCTDSDSYPVANLHTSRLYLTEDGQFDLTYTTVINYDVFEMAPLETADYLTATCPELLNALVPSIFFLLTKQIDIDRAKKLWMKFFENITLKDNYTKTPPRISQRCSVYRLSFLQETLFLNY